MLGLQTRAHLLTCQSFLATIKLLLRPLLIKLVKPRTKKPRKLVKPKLERHEAMKARAAKEREACAAKEREAHAAEEWEARAPEEQEACTARQPSTNNDDPVPEMVLARKMKKGAHALSMHIYPPLNLLKAGCLTD
jgi:hypothetical protein